MKRILLIAAATVAMMLPAFGQTGSVQQQVRDLDKQHREAAIRGDAGFEERYTAPDYISISASGVVSTREQAVARVQSGDIKLAAIDVDDEVVRVYGDAAVITGRVRVRGTLKGKDFEHVARYTRVWVKQGGAWKLASFQETSVAQAGS